ncbi:hypothetical protein V2J09_021434 [Rumex salicifolius]
MKRKHGHKKGESKKKRVDGVEDASKGSTSIEAEDNSDVDDHDSDEPETPVVAKPSSSPVLAKPSSSPVVAKPSSSPVVAKPSSSPVAAEPSSSPVADQPTKPVISLPEKPIQKPLTTAVYGRVKVRLKTPKVLEPQVTSADIPIHSDTHSSSGHQKSVEKQDLVMDKIEDSANSLHDAGTASGENPSGKAESIKIKTSNGLVSSNTNQNADVAHKEDKPKHDEPKLPHQDPQYNKKELDASLEVVKKVMKMDAAEPFNVPVNPVELGIPDYFDVIDTPMDFGTVRSNLESGTKYINSESVFKDVRYIWDNCYKYNNKGDFIVDLMKRVKKNFMKYWAAAGLYSDQPKKGKGVEGNLGSDGGSSSQDKKQKKGKGIKKHKDECLCAICIMKRRRKEREQREAQETREAKGQDIHTSSGISDPNPAQGVKSEENTPMGNQCGEEISSSVENSQDADGDEEVEDVTEDMKSEAPVKHDNSQNAEKNKMDNHDNSYIDVSEAPRGGNRTENGSYQISEPKLTSDSSSVPKAYTEKLQTVYVETHTSTLQKRKIELIKAEKERQKSELYKSLGDLESQTLSGLCKTLFPVKHNNSSNESVWEGPHSLLYRKKPHNNSDIFTAVSSFMSPSPPSKGACK